MSSSSKASQKLSFSFEEDEKLVEAISPHPAIYDLRHPLYKDQREKVNIWAVISEEVGRSVADCKKRWRNIKDTHDRKMVRENNKPGSEATPSKKIKKWQLQEQLSFLNTTDVKRRSFSNLEEPAVSGKLDDSGGFNSSEIEFEMLAAATGTAVSTQSVPPKEPPEEMLQKDQCEQQQKSAFRENICYAIEKRSMARGKTRKNLLDEKEDDGDDVSLFFKSIAKSVQKFPLHLQQRAKLETLSLITNIESEMYASHLGFPENSHRLMLSSPSTTTSVPSDISVMSPTVEIDVHDSPVHHTDGKAYLIDANSRPGKSFHPLQ